MRQVIYKNALQYLKGQENFYNNCINSKFIGNAVKCKMCEIFKNIYSEEQLQTIASVSSQNHYTWLPLSGQKNQLYNFAKK